MSAKIDSHFTFGKSGLLPQEEMLEVGKGKKKLVIGIPRELSKYEYRTPLTPEAVDLLVNNGHEVLIQKGAGEGANYIDKDYSECGAQIIDKREGIFFADIILKVSPLTNDEIDMLKGDQVIIAALNLHNRTESYIRKLMNKKVTAIGYEFYKDAENCYPVIRSMSEIAGITSVQIASELLSKQHDGKGVLLGGIAGITPAEVIVLGAGTAAEYATRTLLGLGAHVKVFDHSISRLRRLQVTLSKQLYTSVYHHKVMMKNVKSADAVIGAVHHRESFPRFYLTEDMVMSMKKGSVIIDLSIDQGGCVETSKCMNHEEPVFTKHGVIHYCVPNIPSRVSRTASIALSNVFTPLLFEIGNSGGIDSLLKDNYGLRSGIYIYNGILTNQLIGNYFGISSKDIDLLLAAF